MSLKYKLIVYFLIASVLPVITVILIFRYNASDILIEKNTQYSTSIAINKTESIDRLFGDIEGALLNICTNVKTIDYLETVNSRNYHEDDKYRLTSEIAEKLDNFLNLYQVIDGIYIIPKEDGLPIYRGALNLSYTENYMQNPVYKKSIGNAERIIWDLSPEHSNNRFKLTISKGIINSYNDRVLGVLVIDLTVDNLFTSVRVSDYSEDEFLFVTDGKKQIIYRNNMSRNSAEMERQLLKTDMERFTGNFEMEVAGTPFLVTYTTSNVNNWRIYYVAPKSRILQGVDRVSRITWLVAALFAVFSVFAALFLFFILYSPIHKLIVAMDKIEEGNLDLEVQVKSRDEFGKLVRAYNYLIKQVKTMIEDIKASQRKKAELEIRALQAQIMPHFLYNTLNCTISLARMGKTDVIIDMVASLIDLLRTSANNKERFITIRDEINYVKSYIGIMTYRYDIPVNVTYNVEEDLLNLGILKFTIQPIVENSFVHAFQGAKKNYEIQIRVFSDDNWINIEITDNGAGMESNVLDEISGKLASSVEFKEKLTGIGLENIHQRLVLEFGEPSGLYITSKAGEGTTVKVIFPKIDLK